MPQCWHSSCSDYNNVCTSLDTRELLLPWTSGRPSGLDTRHEHLSWTSVCQSSGISEYLKERVIGVLVPVSYFALFFSFSSGSFGNLHDKEQYYHVEPLNPNDNSVCLVAALHMYLHVPCVTIIGTSLLNSVYS